MGYLHEGVWNVGSPAFANATGEFKRKAAAFRNYLTADGAPGPSGKGGFKAEPGRYHLYVSLACPWAHRTLILRKRKGLEDMIGLSVVHWRMEEDGWTFEEGTGVIPDTVNGASFLRDIYVKADPTYSGRVTVPVLWDKANDTIVSNESSEIIRMLDHAFDGLGAVPSDYYPDELRSEIDPLNERIYDTINNGVYKSGFATTQAAYETNVTKLFETLDMLEDRLDGEDYLVGGVLTEADVRLYTTLVRFDAVYHGHFKCNLRQISDYPNIQRYLEKLYALEGFGDTTDMEHIKNHYYVSHTSINPTQVVPLGPVLPFG
ncbi:MAG: glutathione S-transferase family protein [Pseudomonadota bacterium]